MKKITIAVYFALIVSTYSYATRFTPAKVIFQNGKELTGLIKEPDPRDSEIQYKSNEKTSVEKLESGLIKTLILYFEDDTIEYERVATRGLIGKKITPPTWIVVIERGYTTLYFANVDPWTRQSTANITDKYFFCLRPGEDAARIVSWYIGKVNANETFKREAYKYFVDYPELAEKIKNKTYKYDNIVKVVKEYNTWKKG